MTDPPIFVSADLEWFLRTYFDRDWRRNGADDTEVMILFLHQADDRRTQAVRDAVVELLSTCDSEQEVVSCARAAGLGYELPGADRSEATHAEWFAWIARELTGALERARDPRTYELEQFLGGYFHQDWDLEGPNTAGIVDAFVGDAEREEIGTVRSAIGELLARLDSEQELAAYAERINLGYYPPGGDQTYRAWFEEVAAHLATALGRGC